MISGKQQIETLDQIPDLGYRSGVERFFSDTGQYKKHPDVNDDYKTVMKFQLVRYRFFQIQCPVEDYQGKLQKQHEQKWHGHVVFFKVGSYVFVTLLSLE